MVNALLAGRKTQTRRLIKPRRAVSLFNGEWSDAYVLDPKNQSWRDEEVRYRAGDRLWVRERFSFEHRFSGIPPKDVSLSAVWYWADGNPENGGWTRPMPGIHMPRWVSRLTLSVTDVRVQRLDDITEADAGAEGFAAGQLDDGFGPRDIGDGFTVESPGTWASSAGMFLIAWQKLHPEWDGYSSPWVVALTFSVERGNIDV